MKNRNSAGLRLLFGTAMFLLPALRLSAQTVSFTAAAPFTQSGMASHGFDIAFSGGIGVALGQAREYVYSDGGCVSRLDWTDNAAPFAALSLEASLSGVILRGGVSLAIPVQNGRMEDYDFTAAGSVSQYSCHDSYLDRDFSCFIGAGYLLRAGNWRFLPAVGFAYRNRKWTARDGHLQYPAGGLWTGEEPEQSVTGPVVGYEQRFRYPVVSLSAGHVFGRQFALYATGAWYPHLWAEALDSHFLRNPPKEFYDTLAGGAGWNAGFSLRFSPDGSKFAAIFAVEYGSVAVSGETAARSSGTGDSGGAFLVSEGYSAKTESAALSLSITLALRVR